MVSRLLKGIGGVTEFHQVLNDDAPGFITDCLNWIFHLIFKVLDRLFGSVGEIFQSLGHLLVSGFFAACSAVWFPVKEGLQWIVHTIYSFIESVAEIFRSLGHFIVSGFFAACSAVWSPISEGLQWIVHSIYSFIDSVAEIFRSLGHLIVSGFFAAWSPIRDIGTHLYEGILVPVEHLAGACKESLHWIGHFIDKGFGSVFDFIAKICESLRLFFDTDVPEASAGVWSFLKGISIFLYEGITSRVQHLADFIGYWFKQFEDRFGYVTLAIVIGIAAILFLAFCFSQTIVGVVSSVTAAGGSIFSSLAIVIFSIAKCFSEVLGSMVSCFAPVIGSIVNWFGRFVVWIVQGIGFGAKGISKGTYAAMCMASYGGHVTAGSICAVFQSIGAVGAP